jgi:hypothetical protein
VQDALSHVVELDLTVPLDIRHPTVRRPDRLIMEQGERAIWTGQASVKIFHLDTQAGMLGNKARWVTTCEMDSKALVWITDQRLAYVWPKWKKGTGVLLRVGARDLIMAGHLLHTWITSVVVADPSGVVRRIRRLRFSTQEKSGTFAVEVDLPEAEGDEVGRAFVRSIARRRLAENGELSDEQRSRLECIEGGELEVERLDWGRRYAVPAALKVPYEFRPPAAEEVG